MMLLRNLTGRIPRFCRVLRRQNHTRMRNDYERAMIQATNPAPVDNQNWPACDPVPKGSVFANTELDLADIDLYGFDYDYTLVTYSTALDEFTYKAGRDVLIEKYKYPENIKHLGFNPHFAVRGLHYDIMRGLLLKIDAFRNIQLGTVYRGLTAVPDEEVKSCYGGTHIPKEYLLASREAKSRKTMMQVMDLFALPQMNLLANVTEYFNRHGINYDPEYLFTDVEQVIYTLHKSEILHKAIMNNPGQFLVRNERIKRLLLRLREAGKRLFLISNSGFEFINAGLKHSIGDDWQDLFDVVIVEARKPSFFTDTNRPFRVYHPDSRAMSWGHVHALEKGVVYKQGNIFDFHRFTGIEGKHVLYFGDHVYADLADPSQSYGWRTGAVVPELEQELEVQDSDRYQVTIRRLRAVEALISEWQSEQDPACRDLLNSWQVERSELRTTAKRLLNPQFGSLFRTFHSQTYYSQRLSLYANIYTSSVDNLLNFAPDHVFYPRRARLPHEVV